MRNWEVILSDSDKTCKVRLSNLKTLQAIAVYRMLKAKYKGVTLRTHGGSNGKFQDKQEA